MKKDENKAKLYDHYTYQGRRLESEISKLKSEHVPNIPLHIQKVIDIKKDELTYWENQLRLLYN